MKALKPIVARNKDELLLEKKITDFYLTVIYRPLFDIIKDNTNMYYNTSSYLLNAILNQQIQYIDGGFVGKFDSKISKELKSMGATFSSKLKSWRLPKSKIPMDILQTTAQVMSKFKQLHQDLIDYIDNIKVEEELLRLQLQPEYLQLIDNLESQLDKNTQGITIPPQLTEDAIINIANKYSNNIKELYIKSFSTQQIKELREKIQKNFYAGARADNLIKLIETRYGVSKTKAKFLARQETGLLTAEYTLNRYKSLGSQKWKWSSSHDSVVRPLHKELDGKVFTYDSPPVIDERTGQRGFPRQAYGCRCKQIPLL